MLDLDAQDRSKPKCYFSTASAPTFVNPLEPPTKRRPFTTIANQLFSHTLDVLVPKPSAEALQSDTQWRYARVHMKLAELIQGEFFTEYIKKGNILMLSQGCPRIDPVFSLSAGVLRLEVDLPTFQRLGLEGRVIPSSGRKHVKARYAIELNLRLPSMLHGKKGFERIAWAFKNVLNQSVTWLFHDLDGENDGSGPVAAHSPVTRELRPSVGSIDRISIPPLPASMEQEAERDVVELLEWLTLALDDAPGVRSNDDHGRDGVLSRYRIPGTEDSAPDLERQDLVRLRYRGFLPDTLVQRLFLAMLKAVRTSDQPWYAMSVLSFDGGAYTILGSGDRILIWEYVD